MATTDPQPQGTPTISVATMSAISIDLDVRAAVLPRQSSGSEREQRE